MRLPRLRLTPASWLRLPPRTARLRITLFYGALFLLSGAGLLAITYVLFEHASGTFVFPGGATFTLNGSSTGNPDGSTFLLQGDRSLTPEQLHQLQSQLQSLQAQAARQHTAELHQLLLDSAIALAVMAVLAIGMGWLMAGRVLRPLRTITATARRISASNLDERLALHGPDDEFKELGQTLDGLLERLEASFESQRHFVANASHELRTPLTVERTLLQVALANPHATTETLRSTCEKLLESGRQQEQLIEALLTLASSERGLDHREMFNLSKITKAVLLSPRPEVQHRGLRIETAITASPIAGDPQLVERLVANLVDNAVRHNVDEGWVKITTSIKNHRAVLTVSNSGPIIPPVEVDRLFQPFQRHNTARTHRTGHGLGLSIVQAIASAHDATLNTQARTEGGLDIEVSFPCPAPAQDHAARATRPPTTTTEKHEGIDALYQATV
jgi:signal transduction histidine kinase